MAKKNKKSLAKLADKYACYQKSVQAPEHEVEFFEKAFKDSFQASPLSIREDFCGTFLVSTQWVKSGADRTAVCVDIDPEPLEWGRENNLPNLSEEQQSRIRILRQDVRKRNRPQVDVLAAQNFSFWIFKTRAEVVDYFKIARANLKPQGILITDMMGGGECLVENRTDPPRTIGKGKKSFKYYWSQDRFDPVTHDASFHISFKFKDGSRLKKPFEYHWRFWSIPEVREMMAEAGFSESHVYFEGTDETGEDDGIYRRVTEADSAATWISYVVGVK